MERVRFIARDPDGVLPDLDEVFTLGVPSRTPRDLDDRTPVRDVQFRNGRGRQQRRWDGTSTQIEAMGRVNPLSAALFAVADLEQIDGEWTWIRKSDGRILIQE